MALLAETSSYGSCGTVLALNQQGELGCWGFFRIPLRGEIGATMVVWATLSVQCLWQPPHKWHFRNRKTGVQSLILSRKEWSMDRARVCKSSVLTDKTERKRAAG